jgi:hypothetical protein
MASAEFSRANIHIPDAILHNHTGSIRYRLPAYVSDGSFGDEQPVPIVRDERIESPCLVGIERESSPLFSTTFRTLVTCRD